MAEEGQAGEKTEEPTPERLRKAREKGQVPMSQEVSSTMMLAALTGAMIATGPFFLSFFENTLKRAIASGSTVGGATQGLTSFLHREGMALLVMSTPIMIVLAIIGCLSSVAVSGLVYSPKALKPDLGRISPIKGFKNVVSLQALVRLLMGVAKLIVVLGVTWLYIMDNMSTLFELRWATPLTALTTIAGLITGLMFRIILILVVVSLVDYIYQKWSYRKRMRMTFQELKEERKQYETSPEMKGRMRAVQREMARSRMLRSVPEADVVVVNPTHYAVALKYDRETMGAPQVVAKGVDVLCAKIKEIAKDNDVPIMERPELARALYRAVEIGWEIPEYLFAAVAEVLALIERIKLKRKMALR